MLLLVEDVREARVRLLQLDRVARLELAAQVEEDLCHLGAAVELRLDSREHAATVPERAAVAGTALGMPLGDELERAQLPVLV